MKDKELEEQKKKLKNNSKKEKSWLDKVFTSLHKNFGSLDYGSPTLGQQSRMTEKSYKYGAKKSDIARAKAGTKDTNVFGELFNKQGKAAYYEGLSSMSTPARKAWEDKHRDKINGMSESEKDNYFRNQIFTELFENSEDEDDKNIWNNRKSFTVEDRDIAVSNKIAKEYNKEKEREYKELSEKFKNKEDGKEQKKAKKQVSYDEEIKNKAKSEELDDAYKEAIKYIDNAAEERTSMYREQIENLGSKERERLYEQLDELSQSSNYYKQYNDSDKLKMSESRKNYLLAKIQAASDISDFSVAMKIMNNYYQDTVANNQTLSEKFVNTGAQFVDMAAGETIRAVGMLGGLAAAAIKKDGTLIIDNAVTQYGDAITTTNAWSKSEQERLQELGLSDNQIVDTVDQENAFMSWNTPFNLVAQYGFTFASIYLSMGGSTLVDVAIKGTGKLAKASMALRGITSTAKEINLMRKLIKTKNIANAIMPGIIGTAEGGMNAAETRRNTMESLKEVINTKWQNEAINDIEKKVRENPAAAVELLRSLGEDTPSPEIIKGDNNEARLDYSEEAIKTITGMMIANEDIMDKAIAQYSDSIEEDMAAAQESADLAMWMDFTAESVVNGFIGATLKATLQSPDTQRALKRFNISLTNADDLGVNIERTGRRGFRAAAKKYTRVDKIKDGLREAKGEALEEYEQDLIGAFGQGYSENKFNQYLQNKYGGGEGENALDNDIVESLFSGFNSLVETGASKEAIRDGVFGGLSTYVGGINFKNSINKNKESSNKFEKVLNKIPLTWNSPGIESLFGTSDIERVNKERQATADALNDKFSDKKVMDVIFGLSNTINFMHQEQKSKEAGDEKSSRDNSLGTLVSAANLLSKLEGTEFHDAAMESINARANLDEGNLDDDNSLESKLALEYMNDPMNADLKMTKKEALQQIKQNAEKLKTTIEEIHKETDEVEKLFGYEMDEDVKEGIVYQRLSTKNSKERYDALEEELKVMKDALFKDPNKRKSENVLTDGEKSIIAKFGSIQKARQAVYENQKIIDDAYTLINEAEDDNSASEEQKRIAVESLRQMIDQSRAIINSIQKSIPKLGEETIIGEEENATGENDFKVLTASEIMDLNPVERAMMLNEKRRDVYSAEQLEEIDKVRRIGTDKISNFEKKAQDSARNLISYEQGMRIQLEMMKNPEFYNMQAANIKMQVKNRMLEKKVESIKYHDNKEDLFNELDRLYDKDFDDYRAAERVLSREEDKKEWFEEYKKNRQKISALFKDFQEGKSKPYSELDEESKQNIIDVFRFASSKGLDPEDIDAVINEMTKEYQGFHDESSPVSEIGKYLSDKYFDRNNAVYYMSQEEVNKVISDYKNSMTEYLKSKKEQEANEAQIETKETSQEQAKSTPYAGVFATAATTEEEANEDLKRTKGDNQSDNSNQNEKPQQAQQQNDISYKKQAVLDTVKKVLGYKRYSNVSEEIINEINDIINQLSINDEDTFDSISTKIKSQIAKLDDTEGDNIIERILGDISNVIKNMNDKEFNENQNHSNNNNNNDNNDNEQEELTGNERLLNNAAVMSSSPMAYLKSKYPDHPFVKFWETHGVEKFLAETPISDLKNMPVYFISNSQLSEDLKTQMEANGNKFTEDDIPIIAVVESDKGDINIEGKNYQVIAMFPSSTNEDFNKKTTNSNTGQVSVGKRGLTNIKKVRDLVDHNNLNSIISDNGTPITTTVNSIHATAPEHIDRGNRNKNVSTLAINELSSDEISETQNKSKADIRKTNAYKKAKEAFLNSVKFDGENKIYKYIISKLKGKNDSIDPEIFITPIEYTEDANSNRFIVDLLKSGTQEDIKALLSSNEIIKRIDRLFEKVAESYNFDELEYTQVGAAYTFSESSQKTVDEIEKLINKEILRCLNISDKNAEFRILPVGNDINLYLKLSNDNYVLLGNINSSMTDEMKFNFIKNMLLDENDNIRKNDKGFGLFKWQIEYPLANGSNAKESKSALSKAYDDGILEMSKESLHYSVNTVDINSPFKIINDSKPNSVVANSDNANANSNISNPTLHEGEITQQTPQGQIVIDSDTGTQVDGPDIQQQQHRPLSQEEQDKIDKDNEVVEIPKEAQSLIDKVLAFQDKIKKIENSDDTYYDVDGVRYERVHTVMPDNYNEESSEQSELNGNRAKTAGTEIDRIIRHFFMGVSKDKIIYDSDIISDDAFDSLVDQLTELKKSFDKNHEKVYTNNIVIHGSIDGVKVAGEIDILTIDNKGNFRIYDIKTSKNSFDKSEYETKHKYQNFSTKQEHTYQLNFYKDLFAQHGINISNLEIIPFELDFANGKNAKRQGTDPIVKINKVENKKIDNTNGESSKESVLNYKKENNINDDNHNDKSDVDNSKNAESSESEEQIDSQSEEQSQEEEEGSSNESDDDFGISEDDIDEFLRTGTEKDSIHLEENTSYTLDELEEAINNSGNPFPKEHKDYLHKIFTLAKAIGLEVKTSNKFRNEKVLGDILINKIRIRSNTSPETIVHELIHGITVYSIFHEEFLDDYYQKNPELNKILPRTETVFKDAHDKLVDLYWEIIDDAEEVGIDISKEYGMSSPVEFIAELTNKEFVDLLNKIAKAKQKKENSKKDFVTRIKGVISNVFKEIMSKFFGMNNNSEYVKRGFEILNTYIENQDFDEMEKHFNRKSNDMSEEEWANYRKERLESEKDKNKATSKYTQSRLRWNTFKGFKNQDGESIDVTETMKTLKEFYTEEEWSDMTETEQEHELECKGTFN